MNIDQYGVKQLFFIKKIGKFKIREKPDYSY